MATETQADFRGGLNTRSPAHLIGANQLTELQNVDLSYSDLRGEYGSATGGETDFYYEAGSVWVSATGFTGGALILPWPSRFTGTSTITLVASGTASKIVFTSVGHGLSDEDVIKFINSSEFDKVREEILSPSATESSSITGQLFDIAGQAVEKVTGGSGPDKKLNQYVGGKAWKDTNNPGSVLRFRYNKESGEYEVRDAPRSKADVYPDWQSISTEQFNEMINNLVQWSR